MCEARRKDAWDRSSQLMALLWNVSRQSNSDPIRSPSDYNPFAPPPPEKTFDELFPPTLIPTP
jgi:hypothetical protein